MLDHKAIIKQAEFCEDLAHRLALDVKNAHECSPDQKWGYPYHTRLEEDSRRLRRELLILNKMMKG